MHLQRGDKSENSLFKSMSHICFEQLIPKEILLRLNGYFALSTEKPITIANSTQKAFRLAVALLSSVHLLVLTKVTCLVLEINLIIFKSKLPWVPKQKKNDLINSSLTAKGKLRF